MCTCEYFEGESCDDLECRGVFATHTATNTDKSGAIDISARFGPVDPLNPRSGYQVHIENAHGRVLLSSSRNPADGSPLQTARQCLDVIGGYTEAG